MKRNMVVLTMPDDSGHRVLTYTAEPESDTAKALTRLRRPVLTLAKDRSGLQAI